MVSVLLLGKGIFEYTRAQKWKRAELIAKEMKEFLQDATIKRALLLLDWNANYIDLRPEENNGEKQMHFTDKLITSALRTHRECNRFTPEEVIIKGIFDGFLDRLGYFNNYISAGLITANEVKPYLIYWVDILANVNSKRKPTECRQKMWNFIHEYGYSDVIELCERFGYHAIPPTPPEAQP